MSGTAFIHMHVTSWALLLILFVISFMLLRGNKVKGQKITHMILRLFYILVLLTGLHLLASLYQFTGQALLKGLFGLWVIASMEMVLVRMKKGKETKLFWIQFVVSLVLALYYGYVVLG